MPRGHYIRKVRTVIIPIGPSIAYVPLTQGLFALIDSWNAAKVGTRNWCAMQLRDGHFYAGREEMVDGHSTTLYLARFIMDAPSDMQVDHRIGRTLDDRESQLRFATQSQNSKNMGTQAGRRFKGVTWFEKGSKYRTMIRVNKKLLSKGLHRSPEAAARAYDVAAIEHFGEFARTNFPITDYAPHPTL